MTGRALRLAVAMKETWEVRRASLHDKDALVALCTASVGADDYAIEMLERFILHGVLHVALDDNRIIGMMYYSTAIDGSGWLGAARTHPDYRHRGVATAIVQSFVGLASRSRVGALRLWSSARNTAGNRSAKACGFREVARFTRVKRTTAKGSARASRLSFDSDLVDEILGSPVVRLSNGYVPYDWCFLPLTPANVHLLASAGAFHRVAGGVAVISVHPEVEWAEALEFGLAAGQPARILRAMPSVGHALGLKEVHSFIPRDDGVLEAARKAGFERAPWGQQAILFERPIELHPASYRRRPTYAEVAAGKRGRGHAGPHEDRWNK